IAFCLAHGEAKALITDAEFAPAVRSALGELGKEIFVVDIDDPEGPRGETLGSVRYETLLAEGDPGFAWPGPVDEWDSLSLLYTSGTTGNPKGVLYHHRGAYLNALGNALAFRLTPQSVYLWTLPMFHANGWTYTWAVTAAGATHVCLRKVEPVRVFDVIRREGITWLCAAPTVLIGLANAAEEVRGDIPSGVHVVTAGAAPAAATIEKLEGELGWEVTQVYGLTETAPFITICEPRPEHQEMDVQERAVIKAHQGVELL